MCCRSNSLVFPREKTNSTQSFNWLAPSKRTQHNRSQVSRRTLPGSRTSTLTWLIAQNSSTPMALLRACIEVLQFLTASDNPNQLPLAPNVLFPVALKPRMPNPKKTSFLSAHSVRVYYPFERPDRNETKRSKHCKHKYTREKNRAHCILLPRYTIVSILSSNTGLCESLFDRETYAQIADQCW